MTNKSEFQNDAVQNPRHFRRGEPRVEELLFGGVAKLSSNEIRVAEERLAKSIQVLPTLKRLQQNCA